MTVVRKSLKDIKADRPKVDRAKIATTSDKDIRHHMIEDGENPDRMTRRKDIFRLKSFAKIWA